MIRIGICEDDLEQLKVLSNMMMKISVQLNVNLSIKNFISGDGLLKFYNEGNKLDILFLDIILGEQNGMDIAVDLRHLDNNVEIIFTTTETRYILKAFEIRAYRYIIKPLQFTDIKKQLISCLESFDNKNKKLVINRNFEKIFINISDILYAETRNKELTVYTEKGAYTVFRSLRKIEEDINSNDFVRCHNTYLVNLDKIESAKNNSLIINNQKIPISRTKSKEFKIALTNFLSKKLG